MGKLRIARDGFQSCFGFLACGSGEPPGGGIEDEIAELFAAGECLFGFHFLAESGG
ncbi:hypothetical protein [Streptomyces sp. NL15-2K]|uniref:hypothetical protein n=1 Tax=Streptomyces sp. NL15-2K TaxID=376149 RepID=UPI000FF9DD13|nr:hypothetical protein [Kutzneria buriramensis]WKX06886.1 hypothetical protein Q4V64_05000 [Kutzneria buriramensis]GCB44057.1 hypothetical protein SNL152K_1342 [Streptomyces sp. NL15-2K]